MSSTVERTTTEHSTTEHTLETPKGAVSALLTQPDDAFAVLVLGHGAGAGMHHPFMVKTANLLADRGVAVLRYQFPYMEKGGRRPDSKATLFATVRGAAALGKELNELPLFLGGKSMGGRMSSMAVAEEAIEGLRGLVFFGFPLHPSGKPSTGRADHLQEVSVPMLFLQGTRDKLAELDLLKPICDDLEMADLRIIDGADHSFGVLKRSGRTPEEAHEEIVDLAVGWMRQLLE